VGEKVHTSVERGGKGKEKPTKGDGQGVMEGRRGKREKRFSPYLLTRKVLGELSDLSSLWKEKGEGKRVLVRASEIKSWGRKNPLNPGNLPRTIPRF